MRNLTFLLLLLIAAPAYATTAFCEMERDGEYGIPRIKIIWDEEALTAKISVPKLHDQYSTALGRVTRIDKGESGKHIVNIVFPMMLDHLYGVESGDISESEFIVHEPRPGVFVALGANYIFQGGEKYLGGLHGVHTGKCHFL